MMQNEDLAGRIQRLLLVTVFWVAITQPGCNPVNNGNILVFSGESIQAAIDQAYNGDTITLQDGICHEKIVIIKFSIIAYHA